MRLIAAGHGIETGRGNVVIDRQRSRAFLLALCCLVSSPAVAGFLVLSPCCEAQ